MGTALARIKRRYGSLAEAKAAQPVVLKLLLAHDGAVESRERGRLHTARADQALSSETVLARLLHTHRRRFRPVTSSPKAPAAAAEEPKGAGHTEFGAGHPGLGRSGVARAPAASPSRTPPPTRWAPSTMRWRCFCAIAPHARRTRYAPTAPNCAASCAGASARQCGPLSDLTGLKRTMIAANSFIVATRPLPAGAGDTILPGGVVGSDSRLLLYFRKDAQGRLLLGGRGSFAEPTSPQAWRHLERSVDFLFPQVKGIGYEYRWAGRVAVTPGFMPHVHEPAPGMTIALGYNGRGIGMATTLGCALAKHLASDSPSPFVYPLRAIKPIPGHSLQRLYLAAVVAYFRLLDKLM